MHRTATLLALSAILFASHAQAVNKCRGADGKTVFQDAPCQTGHGGAIVVKPASGNGPSLPAATAAASGTLPAVKDERPAVAATQTETQRLEALGESLRKENRLSTLRTRAIPDAYANIERQKQTCDKEMAYLQAKKSRANNNLAGATWLQSISTEMAALAARCDTESRTPAEALAKLQREEADLSAALRK